MAAADICRIYIGLDNFMTSKRLAFPFLQPKCLVRLSSNWKLVRGTLAGGGELGVSAGGWKAFKAPWARENLLRCSSSRHRQMQKLWPGFRRCRWTLVSASPGIPSWLAGKGFSLPHTQLCLVSAVDDIAEPQDWILSGNALIKS